MCGLSCLLIFELSGFQDKRLVSSLVQNADGCTHFYWVVHLTQRAAWYDSTGWITASLCWISVWSDKPQSFNVVIKKKKELRSPLTPSLSPAAVTHNCCPCFLWQDHLQKNHSRPRPYLAFLRRVPMAGAQPGSPANRAAWTSPYSAQPTLSLDDTNSNSRRFLATRSLRHPSASLCCSSIPGVQVCFDVSCPSDTSLSQSGNLGVTVNNVPDSHSYRKIFFFAQHQGSSFCPFFSAAMHQRSSLLLVEYEIRGRKYSNYLFYNFFSLRDVCSVVNQAISTSETHTEISEGTGAQPVRLKGTSCLFYSFFKWLQRSRMEFWAWMDGQPDLFPRTPLEVRFLVTAKQRVSFCF